jgi:hypothetical protein
VETDADLYSLDYHRKIELEETPMAERLAQYIKNRFDPVHATDYGCSTGIYVRELIAQGIDAMGFDNSQAAIDHCVCPNIEQVDITDSSAVGLRYADLGLCIEVAEHIPERNADDLMRFLLRHTKHWLIFSAAVPGQGGVGHVNCQPRDYWITKFEKRGWVVDLVETCAMVETMACGYHLGWFVNNAMVLRPIRRG